MSKRDLVYRLWRATYPPRRPTTGELLDLIEGELQSLEAWGATLNVDVFTAIDTIRERLDEEGRLG